MAHGTSKPNIIIIYCDDLGYGDLGCYGSPHVKTPHIDALARSGVRFTDWYSNSPVCSPSRASLLTGRYPQKTGVQEILGGLRNNPNGLDQSQTSLATMLKKQGYHTSHVGKWHLGTAPECLPESHGFDSTFGFRAGCVDYFSHVYYWEESRMVHDLWEDGREIWRNGEYLTDVLTNRAVEEIEKASDPFFLYLAYNAPHWPLHAPAKYLDRFRGLSPDIRIMAAMISAVDDGVAAVIQALKKKGAYENTLVFFSSDNGPSNEWRNWLDGSMDSYAGSSAGIYKGKKASLFDGGIRMPAIISWPDRIIGGQTCHDSCAMMDIFPTCLESAGAQYHSSTIDGVSILPLLTENTSIERPPIFWEYHGQLAVRKGPWKLVLNGRMDFGVECGEQIHLSDLSSDPSEQKNLAERHPDIVADLTDSIRLWCDSVGLSGPS